MSSDIPTAWAVKWEIKSCGEDYGHVWSIPVCPICGEAHRIDAGLCGDGDTCLRQCRQHETNWSSPPRYRIREADVATAGELHRISAKRRPWRLFGENGECEGAFDAYRAMLERKKELEKAVDGIQLRYLNVRLQALESLRKDEVKA